MEQSMSMRCALWTAVVGGWLGCLPGTGIGKDDGGARLTLPPTAQARLVVRLTAQPNVVTPGQKVRLEATVTHDGKPASGAEVVFEAGAGSFLSSTKSTSKPVQTDMNGVARDVWSYEDKTFARAYVLSAKATLGGETARAEATVQVVDKLPPKPAVSVTAQPQIVAVGQKARIEATVTFDGKPVPGVEVVFEAGGGQFQSSGQATSKPVLTGQDGVSRDYWSYPDKNFARGYVLYAKTTLRGETVRGEVALRVVNKID